MRTEDLPEEGKLCSTCRGRGCNFISMELRIESCDECMGTGWVVKSESIEHLLATLTREDRA